MNHHEQTPAHERYEPTREDVLIGRVVDGEASAPDWDALEVIARSDAAVWERLGRAQRAHARLEREVEDAIALAELIDVPSARVLAITGFHSRLRQYAGWAAAAVIGVAWLGAARLGVPGFSPAPGSSQVAGVPLQPRDVLRDVSPEQLIDQYVRSGLARGNVVGEMPAVFVDARDLEGGKGKEVWFMRQILERRTVTDMSVVSVQLDENGTPRYVPQEPVKATPVHDNDAL